VAETTDKGLICISKVMGQVYQCWWRISREVNFFSRFEHHMFYVLRPLMTYLLILPRTKTICTLVIYVLVESLEASVLNLFSS
jgi:hypothetical protein